MAFSARKIAASLTSTPMPSPLIKLIVAFMSSLQLGCRCHDLQIYHWRKRTIHAADYNCNFTGKKFAGAVGFEPTIHDTKNRCLTTWPRPSIFTLILQIVRCKYLKVERDYSDQVLADQLKNRAIGRKK